MKNKIYLNIYFIILLVIYLYIFIKFCFSNLFLEYYSPELLINYSAGFIRRGLLGSIFLYFNKIGINALLMIRLFNIFSFLLIVFYFIKNSIFFKIDFYFLLFPFILPYLLLCNMLGFRDYFLLLLTIPIFKLYFQKQNTLTISIINILIIFGILSHEIFIFMVFPFVLLLLAIRKKIFEMFFLIPSFIVSIFVLINHGTLFQAQKIYAKISFLIPSNLNKTSEIPAPILALSGKLENHISYVFSLNNMGFSRGLVYLLFIFFLIFILYNFNNFLYTKSTLNVKILFVGFITSILFSIPLYYAAIDWQRFINMSLLSSFIFTFIYSKKSHKNVKQIDFFYQYFRKYLYFENKTTLYTLSLLIIVPYISLGSQKYLFSNSLIIIYQYISKIIFSL